MEYERWILEEDELQFEFDGRGYRFEPEYTAEELHQREIEMQANARATEAPEAPTDPVSRITGSWWCTCGRCRQMPTEEESLCCQEWDPIITADMGNLNVSVDETEVLPVCITQHEVRQLINKPVLEMFFWVPKINWKKRPTPEGPNGQLSERQYRLVAYRVILEWAVRGDPLGRGNRIALPSCVVWAVREAFPSPTEEYTGFKPRELLDFFLTS